MIGAAEVVGILLQALSSLLLLILLLRFLLQLVGADFYNPISQLLNRITNPLLSPLRRVVPRFRRQDLSPLVLLLLVQMLCMVGMLALYGRPLPGLPMLLAWALVGVLVLTLNLYFFILLAVIILSWVAPGSAHPMVRLMYQLCAPVMAPFRAMLPPMGGLDLSPILLFIAINILENLLLRLALGMGLEPALVAGW